jgi:hypothetical protein
MLGRPFCCCARPAIADRDRSSETLAGNQAGGEAAREPDAYDDALTKAEASGRIDALKAKLAKERDAGVERSG